MNWLTPRMEKAYSLGEALFYAVLHCIAILLAILSAEHMLTDVWGELGLERGHRLLLFGEVLLCTLVYEILLPLVCGKLGKKERWLRTAVVAAGLLCLIRVVIRQYWKAPLELEDGFLMVGNSFLQQYNEYHHTSYLMDNGVLLYVSYSLTLLLAALIFGLSNLSYLIRRQGFWILLPTLVWAAELTAGVTPSWGSQILYCVSLYLFFTTDTVGRIGKPVNGKGLPLRRRLGREILRKVSGVALLLAVMGLVFLVAEKPARSFVQDSRMAVFFRNIMIQEKTAEGGGGYFSFEPFARASRVTNREPEYRDAKILRITGDRKPEGNLYLKDFEAMTYQNGKWISKDSLLRSRCIRDDRDENDIRHLLNEGPYTGLFLQPYADTGKYRTTVNYTIRYQRLSEAAYPVPYFAATWQIEDEDLTGDVLLRKKLFQRTLSFDAPAGNVFGTAEVDDLSKRFFLMEEDDNWSWYDAYVKENYLGVSRDVPGARSWAGRAGYANQGRDLTETNRERLLTARRVASLLSEYTYSWDLAELPEGSDPVEFFLAEGRRGYCVHFASAGVMILRAAGVPARYVEGYIVKQESFREGKNGTYTSQVLDRNRHAWAEIYLDHVGWIPVEMTPGYSDTSQVLQTDAFREEERRREQEEQQESSEPTGEAEDPSEEETRGEEMQPEESTETIAPETTEQSESTSRETAEQGEAPGTDMGGDEGFLGQDQGASQGGQTSRGETGQDQTGQGLSHQGLPGDGRETVGVGTKWRSLFRKLFLWIATALASGAFLAGVICLIRSRIRAYYIVVDREFDRGFYNGMVLRIHRRLMAGARRTGRILRKDPTDGELVEALKRQFPGISREDWDLYLAIVKEAAFSGERISQQKARVCREIYEQVRLFSVSEKGHARHGERPRH